MNKSRGFTLIEILLVTAIVSLISSVVVGQLNEAREKGTIAAGQKFSSSLHHTIGDELVGEWKFDQDTYDDTSGYGNDGNPIGTTFTDGIMGRAINLDGSSYVDIGVPPELNITDNSITVEAWVYGEAALGSYDSVFSKADTNWTGGGYGVYYLGGGSINFFVNHYNSYKATINFSLDKWHHVAGVYNGTEVKIFVDGVEGTPGNFNGTIDSDIVDPFYVGQGGGTGYRWHGKIDDVRVYEEALSVAQIQQHYVEGLSDHQTLASK